MASATLVAALTFDALCSTRWDVNFDCMIDDFDYDAVLDFIDECVNDPCYCEGGGSFAYAPGGGLSLERFTAAMTEVSSHISEEQVAMAWEHFLAQFYD